MYKTNYRGARDLLVAKISAPYDPWGSNKCRKTKIAKFVKISIIIDQTQEKALFWGARHFWALPSTSICKIVRYTLIISPVRPKTVIYMYVRVCTSVHMYRCVCTHARVRIISSFFPSGWYVQHPTCDKQQITKTSSYPQPLKFWGFTFARSADIFLRFDMRAKRGANFEMLFRAKRGYLFDVAFARSAGGETFYFAFARSAEKNLILLSREARRKKSWSPYYFLQRRGGSHMGAQRWAGG